MKPSTFLQSDHQPTLRTPTRGLNAAVKSSLIFQSHIKSNVHLANSLQDNQKLMCEYVSRSQNFLDNPTTYDNSLAKPNKVNKSVLNINLNNSPASKHTHSHSQFKRKKFISVTQRGQQPKIFNSQKKINLITERQTKQQSEPITKTNPFSTFRQLLTPTSSLKQYWSTMIQTLSNGGSKVEQRQQQENIMSEDVLPNYRDFSVAERARMERKSMMNSLIFTQTKRSHQGRAYTEMEECSPVKRDYILTTEPECHMDSRNFMVFEEKIGHSTLTRKDSLILALMDELENDQDGINQQDQTIHKKSQQKIPCANKNGFQPTRRYQNLISRQSEQTQHVQQSQIKGSNQLKGNKIKCISLIQKQQSYKYRHSLNQPQLQGQFMEMKKKTSKRS